LRALDEGGAVPITERWSADIQTAGGSGSHSATVKWVWGAPRKISAQAALNGFGAAAPRIAEVGFQAFVKNGEFHTIGGEGYGSWRPTFIDDGVTELRLGARCSTGWVKGGAIAYGWS
jgi:hypothetical protein